MLGKIIILRKYLEYLNKPGIKGETIRKINKHV